MAVDIPAVARTESSNFSTENGTIHVSKPFRSRASKKLRALVTFTPRTSHFDTNNERSGSNEFRVRTLVHYLAQLNSRAGLFLVVLDFRVSIHATDVHNELRIEWVPAQLQISCSTFQGCNYARRQ